MKHSSCAFSWARSEIFYSSISYSFFKSIVPLRHSLAIGLAETETHVSFF